MLYKWLLFLWACAIIHTAGLAQNFDLQGHRGARGLLPENSLPGFLKALDWGVMTLEMDVVISKDQQVVLSHEPFMAALICNDSTGTPIATEHERQYNLYAMTLTEVQQFDCGCRGNARFPEQQPISVHKPTLIEVITAVEQYCREKQLAPPFYNIETKSTPAGDLVYHPEPGVFAELLYQVIQQMGIAERTFIQSFDVRTLQYLNRQHPEQKLVLLVENQAGLADNLEKLGFVPEVYSPHFSLVTPDLVKTVHQKGMRLIPWTVNDVAEAAKLKAMGVDGLITDYPDRIR
ncbi:MAG TPA: glycerophosphodiester phosphodiesterase [Microscillaceae bacterium]|jgi:glycerophosphoryl diester phosphodiesterase|nr:glycerophosphodiester phosphodiesterase [Microscillaceae bacterium]